MVLRMARPATRDNSTDHQFRQESQLTSSNVPGGKLVIVDLQPQPQNCRLSSLPRRAPS